MSKLLLSFSTVKFRGFVQIKADRELDDVAKLINSVLGINLEWDNSGYFEEYPALICAVMGVRFDLLGTPEYSHRATEPEEREWYTFDLHDLNEYNHDFEINLSPNIVYQLKSKTDLDCKEGEWREGMVMERCKNRLDFNNE